MVFVSTKIADMNSYENVVYSTKEMKNEFNGQNDELSGRKFKADEIYLKDYTFLPSIEFTQIMSINDGER